MAALLIGLAAAFNLYIIYLKIEHKRYLDASLDALVLFLLNAMFSHSAEGAVIATVGSAIISLILLFRKPKFPIDDEKLNYFIREFKERMPQ